MKPLNYLTSKEKRAVWLRAFHMWQRRPYEVAPLKNEPHECKTCKTVFMGNYCPRCGQAAEIGRFSFKKALMMFLDIWAIGNRSMLRSIRDLMLRPGYMIRDYLRGMQSAYFPPFKMFCLLAAFSLIAEHGFDLGSSDYKEASSTEQMTVVPTDSLKETLAQAEQPTAVSTDSQKENIDTAKQETMADELLTKMMNLTEKLKDVSDDGIYVTRNGKKVESPMAYSFVHFIRIMNKLWEKNPSIFAMLTLMLFSLPLYLFLRHSPNFPDMRYSEFVVALVYTSNAYSIYSIIGDLLGAFVVKLFAVLIIFVALKQFSGYTKKRLLGYITISLLITTVTLAILFALGIYILYVTLE